MQAAGAFTLERHGGRRTARLDGDVHQGAGRRDSRTRPPPSTGRSTRSPSTSGRGCPVGFRQVTGGVLTAELRYLDVRDDAPLPDERVHRDRRRRATGPPRRRGLPARLPRRGARTRPAVHTARPRLRAARLPARARGRRTHGADRQPPRHGPARLRAAVHARASTRSPSPRAPSRTRTTRRRRTRWTPTTPRWTGARADRGAHHVGRLRRRHGEHRRGDHVVHAPPLGRQGRRPADDRRRRLRHGELLRVADSLQGYPSTTASPGD